MLNDFEITIKSKDMSESILVGRIHY